VATKLVKILNSVYELSSVLATKFLLMKVIEVKEGKTTTERLLFVLEFCYMIPALIQSLDSLKKWKSSRVHGNMARNLVFSQLTLEYNEMFITSLSSEYLTLSYTSFLTTEHYT
jgi:hypothetical protein